MKRTLFILAFFLTTSLSFAQHSVNQDVYRYIMVDGHQRFFSVHFPSNVDPSQPLPVVFAFHSATSDYQSTVDFFNFNGLANVNRIIMVYPNAMASTWSVPGLSSDKNTPGGAPDDVHFTSVLLDTLISDYNIDTNKVFATGMSLGGIFTLYLASKLGNRLAAIAPVCASISDTLAKDFWFPRPIPMLLINGMEDPVLNYNGGMTSEFTQWNDHKDDGIMMGTEDLVDKVVKMDSCDVNPVVSDLPNTNLKDECSAVETVYTNNQHIVDFIAVVGGGHAWPGGPQYFSKELIGRVCKDFNAEEKIMKFFLNVTGTKVLQE